MKRTIPFAQEHNFGESEIHEVNSIRCLADEIFLVIYENYRENTDEKYIQRINRSFSDPDYLVYAEERGQLRL